MSLMRTPAFSHSAAICASGRPMFIARLTARHPLARR
jgi:hypothetical protein